MIRLVFVCMAAVAGAADWTNFQDPLEQAFTVDVPQGWAVKGGLFRLGYSDARPMIDLTSPDRRINVRLGDVAIPVYFVPNQFHSREGDVYDLGAQAQMTVAKYRPGVEYAELYAHSRFKDVCATPGPRETESGPPIPEQPEETAPVKTSSGTASWRCESNRVIFVYATTSLYQGFWGARTLVSFVAPADQVSLARNVAVRSAGSLKINPQWRERQKKLDQEALVYQRARQQARMRELSAQVAQFEMKMQAMRSQVNSFERRQAAQAKQVEEFGNILTGITPTIDPLGNRREVFTGTKSRYWTDGQGRVINTDVPPGAGWKEMQVVK